MTTELLNPSRRGFLQTAAVAGVGLVVGFHWSVKSTKALAATTGGQPLSMAFVRIAPNNTVTVIAKHLEMGQGIYTGLATILAEELDADWTQVKTEAAPADSALYGNHAFGGTVQGTGGSTAISNSFDELRQAGATAKAMLVAAAAQRWSVPVAEITVAKGVVTHAASKRHSSFGDLAEEAAKQTPPKTVTLKDPKDYTLIGTRLSRVDTADKTNGKAIFTIDIKQPGQLTALLKRPDRFGGKVKSFDATAAEAIPGVRHVVAVPQGVAVVADNFWAAKKGRDVLNVTWDDSTAEKRGTAELLKEYTALANTQGFPARTDGDAIAALSKSKNIIERSFEFPYLAHAPMEPMDCVVQITKSGCEIWTGDQFQTADQGNIMRLLGLPQDQVKINTLYAGGSFGRRANMNSDFIMEAVEITRAVGGEQPVKLMWTREDDIKGGYYRPMYVHKLSATLDKNGMPAAWRHRVVGQPIMIKPTDKGVDRGMMEGSTSLAYDIPNLAVEQHMTTVGVPVLWWRSVGHTHNAYSTEVFMDDLAAAAGRDPVDYRRALLQKQPRLLAVLNLVAEKAEWGKPLPKGRGRGVAVHEAFKSFAAQVAEVTVAEDGSVTVDRVVCVIDCGLPINPDVIKAQVEGSVGFGLAAALHGAVTLTDGVVDQSNFDDYPVLRIEEMPVVEVHIVPSTENPTGIGEPAVPPVAPAVANAIRAATGMVHEKLPFATA